MQGVTASYLPAHSKNNTQKLNGLIVPVLPKFIKERFWYYKTKFQYRTEDIIVAELTKGKTSKFTLNTEKFEDYVNSRLGNEMNSKDEILEFRKRFLDGNKNFIKEKKDVEFEERKEISYENFE